MAPKVIVEVSYKRRDGRKLSVSKSVETRVLSSILKRATPPFPDSERFLEFVDQVDGQYEKEQGKRPADQGDRPQPSKKHRKTRGDEPSQAAADASFHWESQPRVNGKFVKEGTRSCCAVCIYFRGSSVVRVAR